MLRAIAQADLIALRIETCDACLSPRYTRCLSKKVILTAHNVLLLVLVLRLSCIAEDTASDHRISCLIMVLGLRVKYRDFAWIYFATA